VLHPNKFKIGIYYKGHKNSTSVFTLRWFGRVSHFRLWPSLC